MQDFTIFPNYFFVIYLHFIIKSDGFIAPFPFITPPYLSYLFVVPYKHHHLLFLILIFSYVIFLFFYNKFISLYSSFLHLLFSLNKFKKTNIFKLFIEIHEISKSFLATISLKTYYLFSIMSAPD